MRRATLIGFVLCLAVPATAQFSSNNARQRYDKATKGADIDDFVTRLHSEDPVVRLEAVKSLAATRDPKIVEHLISALGDPDVRVQAKAVEILGEMRATESTQVLIQHLFLRNTEPQMKQRILASLGKIGDPRAARPITEFLQRDLDPQTRGTAIFALGDIGSTDAVETLEKISKDDEDPNLRRLASDALARIQHHQTQAAKEAKVPAQKFLAPAEPGAPGAPPQ